MRLGQKLLCCAGILLFTTGLWAQVPPWKVELWRGGDIVPYPPFYPGVEGTQYDLGVKSGTYGCDLIFAHTSTGVLTPLDGSLGIGHTWFLAEAYTVFDASYVQTKKPFFDLFDHLSYTNTSVQTPASSPFYVAFWLGHSDTPKANGLFGWAKLENSTYGLVMQDQFIAQSGGPVIVAVPEPSTYLLMAFGVGWIRRLKFRK